MTDTPIVTQADRDAAARLNGYARYQTWKIAPTHDEHWMELCSKDFARHRIASTVELTEALRTISDDNCLDPWAVARAALAKAGEPT
jgi:hypothetical protein